MLISKLTNLCARLTEKLKLEGWQPWAGFFGLSQVIVPTVACDELLTDQAWIEPGTKSATGDGHYLLQTVPQGERWHIDDIMTWLSSGTYLITVLGIAKPEAAISSIITLKTGSGTNIQYEPTHKLILDPRWQIGVYISNLTAGGEVALRVVCRKEYVK